MWLNEVYFLSLFAFSSFIVEQQTISINVFYFIMASEMLTSSGKITFSALNGPAKRSDKLRIESEIIKSL